LALSTSTLFAAFEVATGKVIAAHKNVGPTSWTISSLAIGKPPSNIILDNLNVHKPRNDRWLKRHPNVRFHFTATRATWLNQCWKSLHGASFTSVKELYMAPPERDCDLRRRKALDPGPGTRPGVFEAA